MMTGFSWRMVVGLGVIGLTSCSTQRAAKPSAAEYSWKAAAETYSTGDYNKTLDHLDQVLKEENDFTTRAIPWRLVLTSGMARGYMDLADHYAMGAKKKSNGLEFRKKASEYRTTAKRLALQFAQNVDQFERVPLGKVPLVFGMPKGSAVKPALLVKIASGIDVTRAEQELAEKLTVERGVLMTACVAVGSHDDVAKARELLRVSAGTSRGEFGNAIGYMLKLESGLFARDKLDDPELLAAFQKRADAALTQAAKVGSARIVQVGSGN
jgi:hypothetical protein